MWPFKRKKQRKNPPRTLDPQPKSRTMDEVRTRLKRYRDLEATPEWVDARKVLDRHFALTERLRKTYAARASVGIQPSIAICEEMIRMAPQADKALRVDHEYHNRAYDMHHPGEKSNRREFKPLVNLGYKQLVIICEKQGDYAEAIRLSRQAKKQGWAGDWDKRIARLEAKQRKGS